MLAADEWTVLGGHAYVPFSSAPEYVPVVIKVLELRPEMQHQLMHATEEDLQQVVEDLLCEAGLMHLSRQSGGVAQVYGVMPVASSQKSLVSAPRQRPRLGLFDSKLAPREPPTGGPTAEGWSMDMPAGLVMFMQPAGQSLRWHADTLAGGYGGGGGNGIAWLNPQIDLEAFFKGPGADAVPLMELNRVDVQKWAASPRVSRALVRTYAWDQ